MTAPRIALAAVILGVAAGGSLMAAVPPLRAEIGTRLGGETRYQNPVIGTDFADPTILQASDGWTYAYSTEQLTVERMANIQVARSRDLVDWDLLPDALPEKPDWAEETRDFWAPSALEADGRTVLHFAALHSARTGMCLGVATAERPAGPFTDVGEPLRCGASFVNIDPMAFRDPASGEAYLYWGSAGSPIMVQPLSPDLTAFTPGSEPIVALEIRPELPYEGLIEAPWVIERSGTYYLFYSGDNCCDPESPSYAIMVARSGSPLGPFERPPDEDQRVVLESSDRWLAPGHNATARDAGGSDWLVYHAIDARDRFQPAIEAVRRPMLMDPLRWVDGWPEMAWDAPSDRLVTAPPAE